MMTPEEREQLIEDVIARLVRGESIGYITDSGASKSMSLAGLLIRQVEDGEPGFEEFMNHIHVIFNCGDDGHDLRWSRNAARVYAERIARPWVEDFITEIERDIADRNADDRARAKFDDDQQNQSGG